MNSIVYLLQVTACTAVFYLFYYLFLNRLTFFVTNRWYLLVTVSLSFIIPIIKLQVNQPHIYTGVVQQVVYTYTPKDFIPQEATQMTIAPVAPKANPVHWSEILKFIYLAAVMALTIQLAFSIIAFFKRVKGKRIAKMGKVKILSGNEKIANGSFLNYIFLNDAELSADEIQQIIAHEMLHVKLFHSVDRIIVKIAQIILWFNPFIYLYARSVEENHEFEVDRAIARNTDKHNYANLLLHLSVAGQGMLYHNFSKVPLKKRITMLFNQPSNHMKKIVYVLIVPVVLVSCLAFAGLKSSTLNKSNQTNAFKNKADLHSAVAMAYKEINDQQPLKDTSKSFGLTKNDSSLRIYEKTRDFKHKKELVDAARNKVLPVEVKKIVTGKINGYLVTKDNNDYLMIATYGSHKPATLPLKPGDKITVSVRMAGLTKGQPVLIWAKYVWKNGVKIFQSPLVGKTGADTIAYQQKGTSKDAAASKNRAAALAYINSLEGQEKQQLCKEVMGKTIKATVKAVIPNTPQQPKDFTANGGVLINYEGKDLMLQTHYGQGKELAGLLKPGDEITIKAHGASFRKDAPVFVEAAYVLKNNIKIYHLAEAGKIPEYPFLYEANKVRFADGQVSNIVKYPNGKWKSALFETASGYKFNLSFKPTAPELSGIAAGDHVRLRFVHEVKTGAKIYRVNDWVAISTDVKDYGVKNPEMFDKYYEPVKEVAVVSPNHRDATIELLATDHVIVDKTTKIQDFYGNVRMKSGETEIKADHIRFDQNEHLIIADANLDKSLKQNIGRPKVIFSKDNLKIISDSIIYNYSTGVLVKK